MMSQANRVSDRLAAASFILQGVDRLDQLVLPR